MQRLVLAGIVVVVGCLTLVPSRPAESSGTLDRPYDPVVLTGADVPWLEGVPPNEIVAFRDSGGWQQVPVQVDERATKTSGQIYNKGGGGGEAAGQFFQPPTDFTSLVYADSGTFTGPDPDATFDADDELVFMAKDSGAAASTSSQPAGTIAGTGVQVAVTDSLDPGSKGFVYLFRSDGSLSPGAGQQYVSYTFNLLSGPYLTTYAMNGPNPENSVITSPYYSHHFADRWISDELRVTTAGASGADILDRHKALFAPGACVRSENTFSDGEGAFIANKIGPVRVVRSYIGANSGPLTQRDHIFYERREDIRTFLRVHAISGMMDFLDYSPDATGMVYRNNLDTTGVTIDGDPDTVTLGAIEWEMVSGAQGSLVLVGAISTNIANFTYTSYYLDDSTPGVTQCTGDAYAYGSSGVRITQSIPCTDPAQDCTNYLRAIRTVYFETPGLAVADAEALAGQAGAPLTYTALPFSTGAAVGGVAALPEVEVAPLPSDQTRHDGLPATVLVATLAVVALAGAAWYVRRRS